jgi:hypothetical protein
MAQIQKQNNQRLGEGVWNKMPRVNAELFTLTYGSMVMQLIKDYDDVQQVNQQLEKMGRSIGCRIIFWSRTWDYYYRHHASQEALRTPAGYWGGAGG